MHYIRALTAADAKAVVRLGRKLYPSHLRERWQTLRQELLAADAEECNLSIGLFHNKCLVGYVIGYVLKALQLKHLPEAAPIADREIIYVHDLAVAFAYRRHVQTILSRFGQLCRLYFPGHTMLAHGLQAHMQRWVVRHREVLERIGFQLMRLQRVHEPDASRERYLAQWRAVPEAERRALAEGVCAKTLSRCYEIGGQLYSVELIQDAKRWRALEPEWDSLLEQTPEHTVFQKFVYQQIWWRYFGLSRTLYILVIRHSDCVIGIAPLQVSPIALLGRYYRELGFIGSRWEVDRPVFLFPSRPQACCEAMLRFLVEQGNDWDLCDLYEQAADSALFKQLQSGLRERGYLLGMSADSICPHLHLEGTWQQFIAAKSQKFRKNLKAARRKLEGAGNLAYVSYQGGDMMSEIGRYAALEDRSWKADKKVGCSRSTRYFGFYRDLAATFGPTKHFQVRFLTLDGEPIAGTFGLLHQRHYYSLQIVHDAAYSKYSPGTLLEALEIEECLERGYQEYDFLGGFLNNKVRWTNKARHTVELCVFRYTPGLWLLHFTYFVFKPWIKQLLRRSGVMPRILRLQSWLKSGVWNAFPKKIRLIVARRGFNAS